MASQENFQTIPARHNLRNFHHITRQRKLKFWDQKVVAIRVVKSLVDGDCTERKVFDALESIIIH